MKYKAGIIGCGGIANQKHLPALAKARDRVEITALCDLIPERAHAANTQYGLDARVFTDYKELLATDVDIVYVLTPNVAHCEISVAAFEAGKHVLCEKPMAASLSDAEKMMAAWKKSGKQFTIGYQNRYRPDSVALKRLCDEGALGEIYYTQAHAVRRRGVPTWGVFTDKSKQGGGPLIDLATHSLDLALWMMGNYQPATVTGTTFEKLGKALPPQDQGNFLGTWDPAAYEVEDAAFGFVTMQNGALITLDASWVLNTTEERCAACTLCGTKAGAELTGLGGKNSEKLILNKIVAGKQAEINVDTMNGMVAYFASTAEPLEVLECRAWLDALDGRAELCIKPEEAFTVTKILDAVYASARSGRQILLA
jgi:predicted dehydrogenase